MITTPCTPSPLSKITQLSSKILATEVLVPQHKNSSGVPETFLPTPAISTQKQALKSSRITVEEVRSFFHTEETEGKCRDFCELHPITSGRIVGPVIGFAARRVSRLAHSSVSTGRYEAEPLGRYNLQLPV